MNRVDGVNHREYNGNGGYHRNPGATAQPVLLGHQLRRPTATDRNYNGFTTFVRKSFDRGYSFQVAFTAQKTIDLMSTVPGQQKGAENSVVIDAYNVKAQRGLSSQDISKQLSYNGAMDHSHHWDEVQMDEGGCRWMELSAHGNADGRISRDGLHQQAAG